MLLLNCCLICSTYCFVNTASAAFHCAVFSFSVIPAHLYTKENAINCAYFSNMTHYGIPLYTIFAIFAQLFGRTDQNLSILKFNFSLIVLQV